MKNSFLICITSFGEGNYNYSIAFTENKDTKLSLHDKLMWKRYNNTIFLKRYDYIIFLML